MTFAIIALPIKIPAPDKQTVGTWPIVIVGSNKMLLAIAIEAEENREPHVTRASICIRHETRRMEMAAVVEENGKQR